MEITLLLIRLTLFGILAVAGIGKLLDLDGSEKAVKGFGVPDTLAKPVALLLPVAEMVFAFCLLFVGLSWIGALGALLLLIAFIAGMFAQMIRGNAPDCHCFGQIHSEPVGAKSLIRNFVIALLPIALIVAGRGNQGYPLGGSDSQITQNVVVAFLSVGLIITASYLYRLFGENRKLVRRLEFLEALENGGAPIERDEMGNPTDARPIGAPFPDFSLPDTTGRLVTFEHLLVDFKPKIFLFVSPNCDPCKSMIPQFRKWKEQFEGRLGLVFVSSGSAAENIERFGEELASVMLLQEKKELANKVYCKWTPTALFVSADGNIAGHPAVGEGSISDLFDKLAREDFTADHFHVPVPGIPGRIRIGQPVPEMAVTDISGRTITREFFHGGQTLALFLSTTCSYCQTVVDQLREWERTNTNGTKVVVFSEGERETHEGYGIKSPIVIEKNFPTANKLGMYGTPSAVLIDEGGVIVTETAVGGPAIWSLIGNYDQ
jgi:thiol-disulfide isomerase/thioredoxin/uncharacterized membrane protein YphA (DoxX/SURF4 family)